MDSRTFCMCKGFSMFCFPFSFQLPKKKSYEKLNHSKFFKANSANFADAINC